MGLGGGAWVIRYFGLYLGVCALGSLRQVFSFVHKDLT